jgi:hypothetical protein
VQRRWEVRVDEVHSEGSFGAAVTGTDSGDLIVNGDAAELRGRRASRAISRVGRVGTKNGVFLTLPGVDEAEVAVGDLIVGGGSSVPPGAKRWGAAPEEVDTVIEDEHLLPEWSWDVAIADAVRGSSGDWTAVLTYLPLSVGGHATEHAAIQDLRRKHETRLKVDDEYRAAAIRVVRRSQDAGPTSTAPIARRE